MCVCVCVYHSGCKNLVSQERSSWPQNVGCEAELKALKANPMRRTWTVSGDFDISQSNVVHHFLKPGKSCLILRHVSKIVLKI